MAQPNEIVFYVWGIVFYLVIVSKIIKKGALWQCPALILKPPTLKPQTQIASPKDQKPSNHEL